VRPGGEEGSVVQGEDPSVGERGQRPYGGAGSEVEGPRQFEGGVEPPQGGVRLVGVGRVVVDGGSHQMVLGGCDRSQVEEAAWEVVDPELLASVEFVDPDGPDAESEAGLDRPDRHASGEGDD